jgi:hypothetical protein
VAPLNAKLPDEPKEDNRMPPKRQIKGRRQSAIESAEGTKAKEKEKENDTKCAKEAHDCKTLLDMQPISQKVMEKGVKDLKDFDVKPAKEKDLKESGEIKLTDTGKWIGESLPIDPGGPVEGGITIAQLARRVANLEAIVAKGQAFIQPKERPEVGVKAKKRAR